MCLFDLDMITVLDDDMNSCAQPEILPLTVSNSSPE